MRLLLLLLLLAGCSTMERVDPGTFTIKEALTVSADGRWNRVEPVRDGAEVWTADGMTLDRLAFYVGVAEGETLGAAASANAPRWRAIMSPHDIVELYEAIVTQEGSAFTLERLAPALFGGTAGFLFEHSTVPRDGPALGGLAYGAVIGGKLYLMSYTAPKSYYYAKHLDQVRAIAASARITIRESAASASP
jgi:hypothetical protein